jgi:cytochrome P460
MSPGARRRSRKPFPKPSAIERHLSVVRITRVLASLAAAAMTACGSDSPSTPSSPGSTSAGRITSDRELFDYISQVEPLSGYTIFPNTDVFASGRASGTSAHVPFVRVTLNAVALGALQNGRLPTGAKFPDGSLILKDVQTSAGITTTYAMMFKDSTNRLAAGGWLWAELNPNGSTGYSINNRGSACTSCHELDRGPQNDLVRTFERQR